MTSEDRIQIRISLEAARVNAELLQKDAAKLIGISLKTLQNYENGGLNFFTQNYGLKVVHW